MYRNVVTAMSPDRNAPWPKRLRPKRLRPKRHRPKRHRPKSPVPTGRTLQSVATKADFCGFHFWFLSSFFTTKQLKQDCSNVKHNGRTKETSSWTFFFYAKNFNRLKLSSICNATINPFSHRFTQCEQVYLTITRTGNELEICSNPLKKAESLAVSVKRNLGRFTFVACYGWSLYWGRFRGFMTTSSGPGLQPQEAIFWNLFVWCKK